MASDKNAKATDIYFSLLSLCPEGLAYSRIPIAAEGSGRGLSRLLGFDVVPWDWVPG